MGMIYFFLMFRKYSVPAALFLIAVAAGLIFSKNTPILAFASDGSGNGDIFIADQWGRLINITQSPTGEWDPCWSPDGERLAYTGHQTDQSDIWAMAADGSNPINLTNHPAWDYSPAWSPDGTRIVFVSERDGDAELFVQAVGSNEAAQLTANTQQDRLPDWSPGGDKIAFASVINGAEQLYLLDLAHGNAVWPLLPNTDLSGTNPVWHPNGDRLAFVGWRSSDRISIYLIDLITRELRELYADTAWIGSLGWSANGEWLLFTGRRDTNHDLLALNVASGKVTQLTTGSAWDDFAAPRPGFSFAPRLLTDNAPSAAAESRFGYGVNLADLSNTYLIEDMHFNAIKGYVNRATIELKPGQFRWVDPDNVLQAAQGADANVLLRVHGTPNWARPADTPESHPPTDLDAFGAFMSALAARYRGQVIAYEIWNEPNLNYEWGYRKPNAAEYAALLQTAYRAIKAQDPDALVISAGPAPTGEGNPPESLGDLAFIDGLYRAGTKGYFDALGSHIYAYQNSPDFADPNGIGFDRVAQQREIMLHYDDAATPVWITEMGWSLQTHWDLGEYHNQGVPQLTQAEYLRRAYQKIEAEWPWVQAAYLFNLDFSRAPWYAADEQMRWYAILNPDRTPRPAFTALRLYREER